MSVELKCPHCQKPLLKLDSLQKVANREIACPSCNSSQNPTGGREKIRELEIWREKLRNKLLVGSNPNDVYSEVMTSQEVVDHVIGIPCVYQARWNELVHHLFLLMSDKQIVANY